MNIEREVTIEDHIGEMFDLRRYRIGTGVIERKGGDQEGLIEVRAHVNCIS
jgi:hypothetical protein